MHKQSISINCNFKNHNKLNQVWLALVRPVCAGDWLMMMLIDDEMTTRTTRRWHHICQWNRPNENCYKCSHSLQTYRLGYRYTTLHTNMNNWLLPRMKFARSAMQPVSHSVSQSLNHPLSWFLSQSVYRSVRPSVSPSVSRPGVSSQLVQAWLSVCVLVCPLSNDIVSRLLFWCAINGAPWNALMYTLQWVYSIHGNL